MSECKRLKRMLVSRDRQRRWMGSAGRANVVEDRAELSL